MKLLADLTPAGRDAFLDFLATDARISPDRPLQRAIDLVLDYMERNEPGLGLWFKLRPFEVVQPHRTAGEQPRPIG